MWISKEEYNLLTQNSELGAKTAMKLAEILTKLNETQLELLTTKQELDDVKDYANHLKASRDEIIKENNAKIAELLREKDNYKVIFTAMEANKASLQRECDEYFADYYRAKEELDHIKVEYNELDIKYQGLLTANRAARVVIEGLTEKNAAIERELEGTKAAYESEHAEANEWFYQYTVAAENHKRAKERNEELERVREELAKEAGGLARDLTHAEVDLVLYKKAFDDIAHAFGDEFRYLLAKENNADDEHRAKARYTNWVLVNLWADVHDIMKNAGWRVDEDGNT